MFFQNNCSFAFPGLLLTKGAWQKTMPAKPQYGASEGILITPNFGFFGNRRLF